MSLHRSNAKAPSVQTIENDQRRLSKLHPMRPPLPSYHFLPISKTKHTTDSALYNSWIERHVIPPQYNGVSHPASEGDETWRTKEHPDIVKYFHDLSWRASVTRRPRERSRPKRSPKKISADTKFWTIDPAEYEGNSYVRELYKDRDTLSALFPEYCPLPDLQTLPPISYNPGEQPSRPGNSFMLYRRWKIVRLKKTHSLAPPEAEISMLWKQEDKRIVKFFSDLSLVANQIHASCFPDYICKYKTVKVEKGQEDCDDGTTQGYTQQINRNSHPDSGTCPRRRTTEHPDITQYFDDLSIQHNPIPIPVSSVVDPAEYNEDPDVKALYEYRQSLTGLNSNEFPLPDVVVPGEQSNRPKDPAVLYEEWKRPQLDTKQQVYMDCLWRFSEDKRIVKYFEDLSRVATEIHQSSSRDLGHRVIYPTSDEAAARGNSFYDRDYDLDETLYYNLRHWNDELEGKGVSDSVLSSSEPTASSSSDAFEQACSLKDYAETMCAMYGA